MHRTALAQKPLTQQVLQYRAPLQQSKKLWARNAPIAIGVRLTQHALCLGQAHRLRGGVQDLAITGLRQLLHQLIHLHSNQGLATSATWHVKV
jgi:hypothetical protein